MASIRAQRHKQLNIWTEQQHQQNMFGIIFKPAIGIFAINLMEINFLVKNKWDMDFKTMDGSINYYY